MEAEKRQQAKDIFNAALQLKPDDRLPFIRQKCGEDKILLTEVESLLFYLDSAENFLERPAVEEIGEDSRTEKNVFDKLPVERKVGPYTLIKKLGRGGFGEVWLAEKQTKFVTKKLAIKLPVQEQVDANAVKHEATLWEQASGHPNVLPIIDADEYDGQIVIVSEYAEDGSLADLLKQQGRFPVEKGVEIVDGILAGLEFLHSRSIIHRDLKPENVLLQGETPRLADFGISRVLRTTMTSSSINLAGTPYYMAPEAFDRKRNEQTDIWSVGVIFYELLTGRRPFDEDNLINLVSAIATQEPAPLPDYVPPWLTSIILKALAKKPENRYQTAREMRRQIREMARMPGTQKVVVPNINDEIRSKADTVPIFQRPTEPIKKRNNYLIIGGLTLISLFILLLSGVGGTIYYFQPKWIFSPNTNGNSQNSNISTNLRNSNSSNVNLVNVNQPSTNLTNANQIIIANSNNESNITNSNSPPNLQQEPTPLNVGGIYKGKFGEIKLNENNSGKSRDFSFQIDIGMQGCVGEQTGRARWISETVAEYQSKSNETFCRLTFIFNGKKLTIKETGCEESHGASCNFEGTYSR